MLSQHVVRVSCSGFVRITDEAGGVALYYTPKERRQILRPVGGSLKGDRAAMNFLARDCGARLFEGDAHDLRFVAEIEKLNELVRWFGTRRDRETDIRRLATTHMTQLGILTAGEIGRIEFAVAYQTAHSGNTAQHLPVQRTNYLIEVFDAKVPPDLFAKIKIKAAGGRRVLKFVSKEEADENCGPGGYVSSLAPTLFRR